MFTYTYTYSGSFRILYLKIMSFMSMILLSHVDACYLFPCLIVRVRISSIMLNRSGQSVDILASFPILKE